MIDNKYTHFPKTSFRPVAKPSKVVHDSTPIDRTMMAVGKNIAGERGENNSLSNEYVYRRMEQRQRMAINKVAMSSDKKALQRFYTKRMGGVYGSKDYNNMYGLYQDGENKMFENAKPVEMKQGDIVYNNLIGEIGLLQDNQDRGTEALLIFQDRSFRVDKNATGWSRLTQDDGIMSETGTSTHAASSAQGNALFKEDIDNKHKNFIDSTMKKIMQEVSSQDHPLVPKNDLQKGIKTEMEHKDTIQEIKKEDASPREAAEMIARDHLKENEDYYKKTKSTGKEMLVSQDNEPEYSEEEWEEVDNEFADDYGTPTGSLSGKKMETRGGMHNYPGGHQAFHGEIGGALAQNNVAPGSRVHVSGPSGNFFGTYKGPNAPLSPVGGSKPLQHYKNSFAGSETQQVKHGDYTIKHVAPGMTPKELDPRTKGMTHSPVSIPEIDHQTHWSGVMKHKESEIDAIKSMPNISKEHTERLGRLQEDVGHFKNFFNMVEKHPTKNIPTTISGQPRTMETQVGQFNKERSEKLSGIGVTAVKQPSPGPFTSTTKKESWGMGIQKPGSGKNAQVERSFTGAVTKSEPIVSQHKGESGERALDINKHATLLAKTNPEVTMYYGNEKGEVVHHAKSSFNDLPAELMRQHSSGKGFPIATTVHGNLTNINRTPGHDSDYKDIVSKGMSHQKATQAMTLASKPKSNVDVKTESLVRSNKPISYTTPTEFKIQPHGTGNTEADIYLKTQQQHSSGWSNKGYESIDKAKKSGGPAVGPAFRNKVGSMQVRDREEGKEKVTKVAIPHAGVGNSGMGTATKTQILSGTHWLGGEVGDTVEKAGSMRGGVDMGQRIQEYNTRRAKTFPVSKPVKVSNTESTTLGQTPSKDTIELRKDILKRD